MLELFMQGTKDTAILQTAVGVQWKPFDGNAWLVSPDEYMADGT